LTAEQTSLKTELEALLGQLSAQSSMTVLSNTSFKDAQLLQRSHNISGTEVDRRQQAYLTDLRQQNALKQQLVSARSRIEQLGFQIERAPVDSAQRVTDLRNRMASLARQQAELEGREGYLLTAPVSGTITALNFHIGRAVDARTPLLAIMPEGSVLEAELFVPSRAIGFIDEGQEVRLLFDAFPYQRFGSFPAEIKAVSGAVMTPDESGAPFALNEATYRVLARLDEQSLLIADSSVALQSGMKLTANIVLERRSFMDWLLEPLRAVARRS
jgi:membrane fusion protein